MCLSLLLFEFFILFFCRKQLRTHVGIGILKSQAKSPTKNGPNGPEMAAVATRSEVPNADQKGIDQKVRTQAFFECCPSAGCFPKFIVVHVVHDSSLCG